MNIRRSLFALGSMACVAVAGPRFPAGRPTTTHARVGPVTGSLVVVGGGNMGPEILARFVALAGGPTAPIVVIPTAGEDSVYPANWGGQGIDLNHVAGELRE